MPPDADHGHLLRSFIETNPHINFFRLQWVDYSGVLRTRIVTRERCLKLADVGDDDQYSLASNCMRMPVSFIPQSFGEDPSEWKLIPDWTSLKRCAFAPRHASVMCSTIEPEISATYAQCPRILLESTLQQFQDEFDTEFRLGFEIEFVLLDESNNLSQTLDSIAAYSLTAGLRNRRNLTLVEDVVSALEDVGIPVHHFHVEIPNQLEIALGAMRPMQAIDAFMFAQEAIRTFGILHGVRASMAPRPVLRGPQNGCHVHISMNSPKLPELFVQGVLEKMSVLCALGMPSLDSYCRVIGEGAGHWIGFGKQNRDLPIRQIHSSHWELRFIDCTANMYLLMASVISAGAVAMREGKPPKWKNCHKELSSLTDSQLEEYGILERMPSNFKISLDAAQNDLDLRAWMGEKMLNDYIKLKEQELAVTTMMGDDERRQRYLLFF